MSDHDVTDDDPAEEQTGHDDAALLRELIVGANPDVVPELIQGASLREMLDSLPAARAAYARIVEAAATTTSATPVPSGSAIRSREPDAAGLSPAAKVRTALDRQRR